MGINKNGFTLAEVLITLGVIGVVAAMTIPTLMNNIQDAQYYTAARKVFSVLSQATEKMVYENSGAIWDNSSSDSTALSKAAADAFVPYLSVIKEDFIEIIHPNDWVGYKSTTAVQTADSAGTRYGLLLKDGTVIRFIGWQNCGSSSGKLTNRCTLMLVDTNGNKSPNMFGRDAFAFYVIKDSNGNYKVVPSGPDTDMQSCSPGSTTTTTCNGCSEYVINNQPLPQ